MQVGAAEHVPFALGSVKVGFLPGPFRFTTIVCAAPKLLVELADLSAGLASLFAIALVNYR